jgi:hypothetical protein
VVEDSGHGVDDCESKSQFLIACIGEKLNTITSVNWTFVIEKFWAPWKKLELGG